MKKMMILFVLVTAFLNISKAQTYAGHREENMPIMDITQAQVQQIAESAFSPLGFTNISVSELILSDDPTIPDYEPSLIFKVTATNNENNVVSTQIQYFLQYNPLTNKYEDIYPDPSKSLPNCVGVNCRGCTRAKDDKGRLIAACTECRPLDGATSFSCSTSDNPPPTQNGTWWGNFLGGLGAVLTVLGTLLGP